MRDVSWLQSAGDYAQRLDRLASLAIRVPPGEPEESVIFEEEQKKPTGIVVKESV